MDLDSLVQFYDSTMRRIVDEHAPEIRRTITVRYDTKKMSPEVRTQKQLTRKLERVWRANKTLDNHVAFTQQKRKYNAMLDLQERASVSSMILDNSGNPKGIFNTLNMLQVKKPPLILPQHKCSCFSQ